MSITMSHSTRHPSSSPSQASGTKSKASTSRPQPPDPVFIYHLNPKVEVTSLAILSSSLVAIGTLDGTVTILSLNTYRPVRTWKTCDDAVISMTYLNKCNKDGMGNDELVIQTRDNFLRFWQFNVKEDDEVQPRIVAEVPVESLGFCAASLYVKPNDANNNCSTTITVASACIGKPEAITIYDIHRKDDGSVGRIDHFIDKSLIPEGESLGMVMHLSLGHDRLIAGYESGHVVVYHMDAITKTWQETARLKLHQEAILHMTLTTDQSRMATCSADRFILLCHLSSTNTSSTTATLPTKQLTYETTHIGNNIAKFRQDGKLLAVGGWDGHIRMFDTKKLKLLAVLECHRDRIGDIVFVMSDDTSGKNKVVAGGRDGRVSIWEIY